MTDRAAKIDPFAPGLLDRETEFAALARALELAGGFSLLFVLCNQAPQRRRLMNEARARLPRFTIQEIHFSEPVNHLLDALRNQLATPLPDAVFVNGLEHSLPVIADAPNTPFIANLNASRNLFPRIMPRPLVLWMPEYVLAAIARGAPDFFSIRSGVYAFAAEPEELADFALNLSAGEYWELESLPLAEKRDRTDAIQRLLGEYESLPAGQRDRRAEFLLLRRLGELLYLQGNHAEAFRQTQRALELAEALGDRAGVARSLRQIGLLHKAHGEYDEAFDYYRQSLRMAEELGDRSGVAASLHQLGLLHQARGEYGEALQCYAKSLGVEEELGNRAGVARSLYQLGRLHQDNGEYRAAFGRHEQSLQMLEGLGDRAGIAGSLHQLGMLHQERGEYDEALSLYEQSLRINEELGDRAGIAYSLHQIGLLHQARGEYGAALSHHEKSLLIKEELGDRAGIASSLAQIGQLFTKTWQYEKAFHPLLNALTTFRQLQSPNAGVVANMLCTLRMQWDEQAFDAAWRTATGEDVPEDLREASNAAS
jgi:tetratricopeptide (TPR) repeat protein